MKNTTCALTTLLGCALLLLGLIHAAQAAQVVSIPELAWSERSDWVNVKTDVTPKAVGDGVADDTAAIQAALTLASDKGPDEEAGPNCPKVVYLPAGSYKITATLEIRKASGFSLIGHGRATVIQWHGAPGASMFWSNGARHAWYNGITWDGRGIAGVGVDHSSQSQYETAICHENEAFLNFTQSGFRVGGGPRVNASADSTIRNCLFRDCYFGVSLLNYNDYVWTIEGCEFVDCGTGISDGGGQYYLRDSHFARSKVADLRIWTSPAVTVRRCTSVGSARFALVGRGDDYPTAPIIQDCQVANWTAIDGAIVVRTPGPVTLLDCQFTNPPNGVSPIRFISGRAATIVVGNNDSNQTAGVLDHSAAPLGKVITIPPGERARTLSSARTHFLNATASVGGKVFDAKVDFGARADGMTDDTAAIQKTLDAARQAGKDAVAYFPAGAYVVTQPLNITGSDYRIEGAGTWTRFSWKGGKGEWMVHVHNPQRLTMAHLTLLVNNELASMLTHTADDPRSRMTYDRVSTIDYSGKNLVGLRFESMAAGSTVHLRHAANADLFFRNCAGATILVNTVCANVNVEGTTPGDGFLGVLTAQSILNVKDNQNLVVESQYWEGQHYFLRVSGLPGAKPGHVTIGGGAPHWVDWTFARPNSDPRMMLIDNYCGRIYWGHTAPANGNPKGPAIIKHTGTNPLDLMSVAYLNGVEGNAFTDFDFQLGLTARHIAVGRRFERGVVSYNLPDQLPTDGLQCIAKAHDDLRQLGKLDLDWNYPQRFDADDLEPAAPPVAEGLYRLRNVVSGLYLTGAGRLGGSDAVVAALDIYTTQQKWQLTHQVANLYLLWFSTELWETPGHPLYLRARGNTPGAGTEINGRVEVGGEWGYRQTPFPERWYLEPTGDGQYRLHNAWDAGFRTGAPGGYLGVTANTEKGRIDPNVLTPDEKPPFGYRLADCVTVSPLQTNDPAQRWVLERIPEAEPDGTGENQ
ncbi:MAG: glycosyl hydrolase family 28-related protein [Armatimonadota bacterium]